MTAEHTAELTAPLLEPISVRGMTIPNRTITAVRRACTGKPRCRLDAP
jgi:hypothetical protein